MIPKAELAKIPAFEGFDHRARNAVGAMLRLSASRDSSVLVAQGSRSGGAYVLLSGEARVVRELPNGSSVDVRTIGPGTLFGLLSCLDGAPRSATVIARGPVRLAELPREAVTELLEGRTTVALRFQVAVCRTLFREMRATNRRLAELAAIPDTEIATVELEPVEPLDDLEDLSESLLPLSDA